MIWAMECITLTGRGSPKKTWLRTTLKEREKSFDEMKPLANNRVQWKSFVNDLCS
jgi:hypothetical protein